MKKYGLNWQREIFMIDAMPQKTGVLIMSKTPYVEIFCVLYSMMW